MEKYYIYEGGKREYVSRDGSMKKLEGDEIVEIDGGYFMTREGNDPVSIDPMIYTNLKKATAVRQILVKMRVNGSDKWTVGDVIDAN